MSTRKQEDIAAWRNWNRTKSSQDLQKVLNRMKPVIAHEVNRWSGSLSSGMLEIKAKTLAVQAIKSYSPSRGAALSTHVTNSLRKLSRTVYTHTQAARLPEHKAIAMSTFGNSYNALSTELGREPTSLELSEDLGWSKKRTSSFRTAYTKKELLTSGDYQPTSFSTTDWDRDPMVDFVYHDFSRADKKLFEDITGYGGAKVLTNAKLMRKHKLTQGQLSYRKRKLISAVKKVMH